MNGCLIPWTHEEDSDYFCVYSLAPLTCLNLTIYRRGNNHLNTKGNVLGQESRGTKDLEQKSVLRYLF